MSRTILIEAPQGVSPSRLAAAHRNTPGTLTITVRPDDRTSGQTALTVLLALGKDLERGGGKALRQRDLRSWTPAWLKAHNITTVILAGVQILDSRNLTWTIALFKQVTTLVLVCDHGTSRLPGIHANIPRGIWADWCPPDAPSQEAAHGVADPPDDDTAPLLLLATGDLPHGTFFTYRADLHRLIHPDFVPALDKQYTDAFHAAATITITVPDVLTHFEQHISQHASTSADMITIVRATQAALFVRGYKLDVDSDRLFRILTVATPILTPAHWRTTNSLFDPQAAAITALYLLNLHASQFHALTMNDIESAIRTLEIDAQPIPILALPLLAAHLYVQQEQGRGGNDPYLTRTDFNPVLGRARKHLGLPIATSMLRGDATRSARPLVELGLKLQKVSK